jgi:ATP-binding cassette subfamily F protein 3
MLVSHDRHFIAKTANKIWEIVDQEIKEFKGGYEEWVAWKERMARQKAATASTVVASGPSTSPVPPAAAVPSLPPKAGDTTGTKNNGPNGAVDKEKKKEQQRLQKRFEQVERSLAEWQVKKQELEVQLGDPGIYASKELFLKTESAFTHTSQQIDTLTKEYEELFEKLMNT